jgi:hypothetical protein
MPMLSFPFYARLPRAGGTSTLVGIYQEPDGLNSQSYPKLSCDGGFTWSWLHEYKLAGMELPAFLVVREQFTENYHKNYFTQPMTVRLYLFL